MSDSLVPVMQIDDQMHRRARASRSQALARELGLAQQCRQRRGRQRQERDPAPRARAVSSDLIVLGAASAMACRSWSIVPRIGAARRALRRAGSAGALRARLAASRMTYPRHKISVEVETAYLEDQSEPREHRYVFSYTITIRNEGECRRSC